jgi:hypothetical protein
VISISVWPPSTLISARSSFFFRVNADLAKRYEKEYGEACKFDEGDDSKVAGLKSYIELRRIFKTVVTVTMLLPVLRVCQKCSVGAAPERGWLGGQHETPNEVHMYKKKCVEKMTSLMMEMP